MNLQYNYVLYVDYAKTNLLGYANSTLKPIERFMVTFKETPASYTLRKVTPPVFPDIKYEEFWYHGGIALGLRRYNDLTIPTSEQGAIYFRTSATSSDNIAGAADCAARLSLECVLKQSIVAAIIVPDSWFEQMGSALGKYNFLPVDSSHGNGAKVTMRLMSNPGKQERFFFLSGSGN